jgi:hypothetical protein
VLIALQGVIPPLESGFEEALVNGGLRRRRGQRRDRGARGAALARKRSMRWIRPVLACALVEAGAPRRAYALRPTTCSDSRALHLLPLKGRRLRERGWFADQPTSTPFASGHTPLSGGALSGGHLAEISLRRSSPP